MVRLSVPCSGMFGALATLRAVATPRVCSWRTAGSIFAAISANPPN